MDEQPCVYLTNDQLQRITALSLDALYGVQITSTADIDSPALIDYVHIDNNGSVHATVQPDGTYAVTT